MTFLTKSRLSTATGAVLALAALYLPPDAIAQCVSVVTESTSPIIAGILMAVGVFLTTVGPSLIRKSPGDLQEELKDTIKDYKDAKADLSGPPS